MEQENKINIGRLSSRLWHPLRKQIRLPSSQNEFNLCLMALNGKFIVVVLLPFFILFIFFIYFLKD